MVNYVFHGLQGWRPNGRPGLHLAFWLQVKVCGCGLGAQPVGCMPALSVTQKRHCSCSMRLVALYKCYKPVFVILAFPSSIEASTCCYSSAELSRENQEAGRERDDVGGTGY